MTVATRTITPIIWLVLSLLTGCAVTTTTGPARFYMLTTVPDPAPGTSVLRGNLAVGLGPVSLPDLYDRPHIVTRPEPGRVRLAEYDRWGGELDANLGRVLAQNLMSRLGTDRLVLYPWSSQTPVDLQVVIRVFQFDGNPGEHAHMIGLWRIVDLRGACPERTRRFDIQAAVDSTGYGDFVTALSRAVGQLSDELASAIGTAASSCR